MGEFFKPWRRKIGVTTLSLSLLLMAGWVRSLNYTDGVYLFTDILDLIASSGGSFYFEGRFSIARSVKENCPTAAPVFFSDTEPHVAQPDPEGRICWAKSKWGFGVGEFNPHNWCGMSSEKYIDYRVKFCRIPYASITIPLTLLSAWLLLSNPRKSKSKSPIECVPEAIA